MTDKGLISKIYKQPNQKMGGRPKYFTKDDIQTANRDVKKMSSLIRDMQIKTTVRYHLPQIRMTITEKSTNNTCWRGYGEKGTFLHC